MTLLLWIPTPWTSVFGCTKDGLYFCNILMNITVWENCNANQYPNLRFLKKIIRYWSYVISASKPLLKNYYKLINCNRLLCMLAVWKMQSNLKTLLDREAACWMIDITKLQGSLLFRSELALNGCLTGTNPPPVIKWKIREAFSLQFVKIAQNRIYVFYQIRNSSSGSIHANSTNVSRGHLTDFV